MNIGTLRIMLTVLLLEFLSTTLLCAQELKIDKSRARDLELWKPAIRNYSNRHYGEYTWKLQPTCIVLHYTVTNGFPWNLLDSESFAGESPGLAVHYVVDGNKIWKILPPSVRSRGCYGINHRAINIEMVALDASDLSQRTQTLETTAQLTSHLLKQFHIPPSKVYSHEEVSLMDQAVVPEVKDLIDATPYHKIDPGKSNMAKIKKLLERFR